MDEEGLGWDRVTLQRGNGLAQGGAEKEGGEPITKAPFGCPNHALGSIRVA